jgi:hypothetical protein
MQVGRVKTYGVAFTVALALLVGSAALNVYQWASHEPSVSTKEPTTRPATNPAHQDHPWLTEQTPLDQLAHEIAALVDAGRQDMASNLMVAAQMVRGCNLIAFESFTEPGDLSDPAVRAQALELAAERGHTLGFGNSGDTWIGVAQDCSEAGA